MAFATLTPALGKAERKRDRTYEWVFIGCIVSLACALAPALVIMSSCGETARAKYEKLRAGMTLQEAQAALGDWGSDTPPADMTRKYLYACSEAFRPDRRGKTKAHYWILRDGLIIGRFDADGHIVAKSYLRAGEAHADETALREGGVNRT